MRFKILLTLVFFSLTTTSIVAQNVFMITSTSKDGPGSINQAVMDANNSPGHDTIRFTPGIEVNASHPSFQGNSGDYMLTLTESVTIDGQGGAINGRQQWVGANGDINNTNTCPGNIPSTTILAEMPNFMDIKSGVTVYINNLSIREFNSIVEIRDNAELHLDNFKATDIKSTLDCFAKGLIGVSAGASLEIKNCQFSESFNWADPGFGNAIISSPNAGSLTIENTLFYNIEAGRQFLINWQGTSSSKVQLVGARLLGCGGVLVGGSTIETNIVNSTMVTKDAGSPEYGNRIINSSTGTMNIQASSIKWNSNRCNTICAIPSLTLIECTNGTLNLIESALGFNYIETSGTLLATIGTAGNGVITADSNTWIEPTPNQDAAALMSITSQPNLITGTPGFKTEVVTQIENNDAELVAPEITGVLIDVINAPLINPISGTPITKDVIGNDRLDANGFRDIGAIQLSLAPILTIADTGDGFIDISWQEPLHHDGEPIIRYEYQYTDTANGTPSLVDAGMNLSASITGLTNGTVYEFTVRAVYNENGNTVNGPFGNRLIAIPVKDTIPTPSLTATAGDETVALSWTSPDLGGRTFHSYYILWKEVGDTVFTGGEAILDIDSTNTEITSLTNDITYEFMVNVITTNGDRSAYAMANATPSSSVGVSELFKEEEFFYPNPVQHTLQIKAPATPFTIQLYDMSGAILKQSFNESFINVSDLDAGMYVIYIQTASGVRQGKIIKQ